MDAAWAAQRLAGWFAANGRTLPWRARHEPYHVLLAEFILQQTRMETGIRYFDAMLRKFPTIEALAAAPEQEVVAAWSGLGYYRRARNLHATCKEIVAKHGGRVPRDVTTLMTLPGIGPYTAGAIASIAYDERATSLDGNQVRVLSRLLGIRNADGKDARQQVTSMAEQLLAAGSPRAINQALMDLGSAICVPEMPRCGECPLAAACRLRGRVARTRSSPAPARVEYLQAALWTRGARIWLAEPRGEGVLGDRWLPPLRAIKAGRPGATLRHVFSHKTWAISPVRKRGEPHGAGRWVSMAELPAIPHSSLTKRLMEWALTPSGRCAAPGAATASRRPSVRVRRARAPA